MKKTDNYNLNMPDLDDGSNIFPAVTENMEILDCELNRVDEQAKDTAGFAEVSKDTLGKFGFSGTLPSEPQKPKNLDDILGMLATSLFANVNHTTNSALNTTIGGITEISWHDVGNNNYVIDPVGTIGFSIENAGTIANPLAIVKTVGRAPTTTPLPKLYKHDIIIETSCNAGFCGAYGRVQIALEFISSSISSSSTSTTSGMNTVAQLMRNAKYTSNQCNNLALTSDRYIRSKFVYNCGSYKNDAYLAVPPNANNNYIIIGPNVTCNNSSCQNFSNFGVLSWITSSI